MRTRVRKWKLHRENYRQYTAWIKYVLLAAGINFVIEAASRHSAAKALEYLADTPLVFFYNTLVIGICYLAVYLVRRKVFACAVISIVWLGFGIANGVVLTNRVTPLTGPDFSMIKDVFSIIELYMTPLQIILAVTALVLAIAALVVLFRKTPRYGEAMYYKRRLMVTAVTILGFTLLHQAALESRVIVSYFSNVAYAYQDYGFPYCFLTSVLDTGMDAPHDYSEKTIQKIIKKTEQDTLSEEEGGKRPNIIFVQLETFFDVTLLRNIELSDDPIPNFHKYMEDYSSGYFEVPVVGAGTANTEFETIVGMNLRYFGPGEYPYKTILKETTCESMAYALKNIGYTAHALHDNTAGFYGRNEVFSMLGFDTFTSIEMMDNVERNEIGWADDSILTEYIMDCLESSEGPDYVYAISVQGHGSYPTEPVLEDPVIRVTKAETEEKRNQYEYYVNQLYEMDQFVKELITAVEESGEETVLVMYGDHLPTMGIEARDMKNGYLYSTSYFIWDNLGLEKADKNLATYQMGAVITDRLGIHEGTMMQYHQKRQGTRYYMQDMEMLQYDMLYGDQYCYGGENPYAATDLQIGIRDFYLTRVEHTGQRRAYVFGRNFNSYSTIAVNGKEQETILLNDHVLIGRNMDLDAGDLVTVQQIDKEGNILRETNAYEIK